MRYGLQITTQPATEPVTTASLQAHLRLDTEADDILLTTYAVAAREMVEAYLGRALVQTTFLMTVAPSSSPNRRNSTRFLDVVELRRSPLVSINTVTHCDANGLQTVLPAGAYLLEPNFDPARIRLDYASGLVPTTAAFDCLQIAFTAGYGADATLIPATIINAIMITAMFLSERRGDDGGELPKAAEWLLNPHRVMYFGG